MNDMPLDNLIPPRPTMENMNKFARTSQILDELDDMGYDVYDERDIVRIIDQYHIDPNRFAQMPYLGGYEQFKKDVLDGKYDDPLPKSTEEPEDILDIIERGEDTVTIDFAPGWDGDWDKWVTEHKAWREKQKTQ